MSFSSLGLSEQLVRATSDQGYDTPSPIQAKAIPAVLSGKDVMAAAQTGTGKTAGFTLPLLQRLAEQPRTGKGPRALILAPTRELAAQVHDSVNLYSRYIPTKSAVVFGGVKINPQMMKLRKGLDVLVATPGRLLDLYQQNAVRFDEIEILVLDEADRMLDMGFIRDIRKILALLPAKRQNLLFSATFSNEIRTLAQGLLDNPVQVEVAARNTTAEKGQAVGVPGGPEAENRAAEQAGARQQLGAGAGIHPHQARRQPPDPEAGARRHHRRRHPRQQVPGRPDPGPERGSSRATSACWWPPTSPPAAWTSSSCHRW